MSKENTNEAQTQGIKTQVENFLKLIRQPGFLEKIETNDPEALRELLNFGNFSKNLMGEKFIGGNATSEVISHQANVLKLNVTESDVNKLTNIVDLIDHKLNSEEIDQAAYFQLMSVIASVAQLHNIAKISIEARAEKKINALKEFLNSELPKSTTPDSEKTTIQALLKEFGSVAEKGAFSQQLNKFTAVVNENREGLGTRILRAVLSILSWSKLVSPMSKTFWDKTSDKLQELSKEERKEQPKGPRYS